MQKFTFTVDVVNDGEINVDRVRGLLLGAVDGCGQYTAVKSLGGETLTDQGLKVWAKRCAGISLATPKVKKVKAEAPVTTEA